MTRGRAVNVSGEGPSYSTHDSFLSGVEWWCLRRPRRSVPGAPARVVVDDVQERYRGVSVSPVLVCGTGCLLVRGSWARSGLPKLGKGWSGLKAKGL